MIRTGKYGTGSKDMKILIKNGRIIDPDTKRDEIADLYLEDGVIKKVQKSVKEKADEVIDASGCYARLLS